MSKDKNTIVATSTDAAIVSSAIAELFQSFDRLVKSPNSGREVTDAIVKCVNTVIEPAGFSDDPRARDFLQELLGAAFRCRRSGRIERFQAFLQELIEA